MPSRGEGMCRECRVGDGYLVVSRLEMDVFMDLGHLERAIMKFLCPPHPQVTALASDGHPEIYYHGALRATCRLEVRELRLQDYSELRRDAPKCLVDVARTHSSYCTNEMMQRNEGVAPWEREVLVGV